MQEVQEEPQGEKHIRATAKATGTPRPELGALTQGTEYLIPESLFDDALFDRVVETTADTKKKGGIK